MLRKIKRILKKKSYNYTKKFKTYNLVESFLGKSNLYFDTRYSKKFFTPQDVESLERFYAASLIAILLNKKKLSILDIGGGSNPIFSYIKKSTGLSTYCTVLETKKFVNIISKKVPNKFKKYIKYEWDINKIKKKFDIVCFISSIQYFKNYEKIILELKKSKPEYFIITRTFFHKNKENFFSVEHSIPGSSHPYIFFSFKKMNFFFNRIGYKLIFQNNYNSNIFSHDSVDKKNFSHKDLVFKRK